MSQFTALCDDLTAAIKASYEEGVTVEDAEKLAGKFLYAQIQVANELKGQDLDARMKKAGLKAVRSAVYLAEVKKADKKPSDVLLEATVNCDDLVLGEQRSFDEAEVSRDQLQNYFNVFKEGHVHFRTIAKGRFE